MRIGKHIRNERGIALLLTIFGLLLLTAVAAAMMFSSDSETTIAVNYRDKEIASYAAVSGLQEARDRLQPLYGDLSGFAALGRSIATGPAPTQLPGAAAGQVFYIINPNLAAGETAAGIAPWNYNGGNNPYFDKELCQEQNMNALGIATNAPGSVCTVVPSNNCTLAGGAGGGWCTYYDNSANATPWKLTDNVGTPIPLPYKWVRITLKADNSAPVYVQTPGSPAAGNQVCWDTRYGQQLQKPAGAGTNCLGANTGSSVGSLTLNSGGTGYSHPNPPTVSFVGGGGAGAAATAQLKTNPGGINSASLSNQGSGYTSAPTVTLVGPDGTGAVLQALVQGSPVTALALNGGNNYCYQTGTTGESVNFVPSNPGTGSVATATVTMTGQACVSGFAASASCKSQKNNTVTINTVPGGTGNGFSGTVTFDNAGKVSATSITNVGNYTAVPGGAQTVTIGGCSISVSYTGGIQIASVNLTNGGQYLTAPTATISGSTPKAPSATQPTLRVTWVALPTNGTISGVQVTSPGSGYSLPSYTLAFSGGGGNNAAGTAVSSSTTTVSGLTLTNGGSGYTSAPQVVICDPTNAPNCGPGAGATATANLIGGQQLELGQVYMLTSLAVTRTGSRSMAQMEAAVTPPWKFQLGGALTLAGPNPNFGTPNSNVFHINGNDVAGTGTEPTGCNATPGASMPAIGVYNSAAASSVISSLGKPNNYTGAQSAPDIQVVTAANPDPTALSQLVSDISSQPGTVNIAGPAGLGSVVDWGGPTDLQTIVVNGDLTLSGNPTGYGVLVVTGNLVLKGDFTWHGLVLVMGTAVVDNSGGGNGQITGAMYVATDTSGTLSSSTFNWNGGGGNGIQYDHCWADDLLNRFPPATSDRPLQILSTRTLEF